MVFNYEQSDRVFEARRKIVGFYLVCRGVVKEVSRPSVGEEVTLSLFKRGNVLFGDGFFLDRGYRETTAEAVTQAKVLMIEKEAFPKLMNKVGGTLGRKIAHNMKRLRHRLELGPCSALKSTAFWLLRLISDSSGSSLSISNKELSDIVGCSPVTISRKLGELQNQGLIEKKGREIRIMNGKGLEEEIDCTGLLR